MESKNALKPTRKSSQTKSPVVRTTYYHGVKNYQWVQDNLHPNLQKYFYLQDQPSPLLTYLSVPENLVRPQDSIRQYVDAPNKYLYYQPKMDENHDTSLVHLSEYGTEYLSDFKPQTYQTCKFKR